MIARSKALFPLLLVALLCLTAGCSSGGSGAGGLVIGGGVVVVNSLSDQDPPPPGTMTLRAAIAQAPSGGTITFAPSLDGGTIELRQIATNSTLLKGEVFVMSQGSWLFQGYQERNYGKSALYAAKNLTVDASSLPHGISLRWVGDGASRARVLAVYGDLTLRNVTISGGDVVGEALSGGSQPYTLARGGGLAVWGSATLDRCTLCGNRVAGDSSPSRDRGAFGGGIYANLLQMTDCIVAGNSATGFGAAGGGVYSVGGGGLSLGDNRGSGLTGCSVSGNSVTAQHAYGGGIYSDGGGPGNLKALTLRNCTIARNKVADHPGLAEDVRFQYYYRGGGIYMSNGSLAVDGCTIAENGVTGTPAVFGNGRPNMGGGGIAATIGDAHVVENMRVWHSIIIGNTLNGAFEDLFTGSLLHFFSYGHNLIGRIDFSQILVSIPDYYSLSRRHWPKSGDVHGVLPVEALDLNGVQRHANIVSAGTDAGEGAVLWYPPGPLAIDKVPRSTTVDNVFAQYTILAGMADNFLNQVLARIRSSYGGVVGSDFGVDLGDLTGLTWYGPAETWPSNPANAPWIAFWHELDRRLVDHLGPAPLNDEFWGSFVSGPLGGNLTMAVSTVQGSVTLSDRDQRGSARPYGGLGDIGAIELNPAVLGVRP